MGLAAALAPSAPARPGSADTSFSGDGSIVLTRMRTVTGLWLTPGDTIRWTGYGERKPPFGRFTQGGRPAALARGEAARGGPIAVLRDGRVVTRSTNSSGATLLARSTPEGFADPTFNGGHPVLLAASVQVAIGPGGQAALWVRQSTGSLVWMLPPDGIIDPPVRVRSLPGLGITAVGFDALGRVYVGTETISAENSVRRLTPTLDDDPDAPPVAVPFAPRAFQFPPSGDTVLAWTDWPWPRRFLLDQAGVRQLPTEAARALDDATAATFDVHGRLVLAIGASVVRLRGTRVERLRTRLPGGGRYGGEANALAVDAQERIVIGGVRLVSDGYAPSACPGFCRDDFPAETRGLIARIEGSDPLIRIVSRRLSPALRFTCTRAAGVAGCRGTAKLLHGNQVVERTSVDLASGETGTLRPARRVREHHRALRLALRVHGGRTGALSTDTRVLRRR